MGQAARSGWSRTGHALRALGGAAGRGGVHAATYTKKLLGGLSRLARSGWKQAQRAAEWVRDARGPAMARVRRSARSFRQTAGPVMARALSQTRTALRALGQATRSGWTRLYRFLRSFSL
jgi:hypothetical protein